MIDTKNVYNFLTEKFGNKYLFYKKSLHFNNKRLFLLCRNKSNKYFCEMSSKKDFLLSENLGGITECEFDGDKLYIGFFNCNLKNSRLLISEFQHLVPVKSNKKTSVGFGDRIGIAGASHVRISSNYDFFPLFAQQSAREITKTSRNCETILHNAVISVFQEGYKCPWGADADHIRDIEWVKIMLNNNYLNYTMFTIDTYDYVDLDTNYSYDYNSTDEKFKERLEKSKKYIDKSFNFSGYKFKFTSDNLFPIVKRYYKCLDFLLDCYNLIKSVNKDFDFEPTFDERDIDTTPEEHFYLVSELINDGVNFTTFAPKYPGLFEKGIDYEGDLKNFVYNLKVHKSVADHYGTYRLSLHSADDKYKVFKYFRDILGLNYHIKTSGTTWMESLRTIAQFNPDLFNKIFDAVLIDASENSKDYYIQLDIKKIQSLYKLKKRS